MYSSITPLRSLASFGDWVLTFIPGATGVVHDAAWRADPARPALAAPLSRAELHSEASLLGKVDGVVEHDHSAVAEHALLRGHRLVVERRVEQCLGEVRAEWSTDLHGSERALG